MLKGLINITAFFAYGSQDGLPVHALAAHRMRYSVV